MDNDLIQSVDVHTLNQRIEKQDKFFLLDVRTAEEVAICRLPGSVAISVVAIPVYLDAIPDDIDIIIYCHHGLRSLFVARYLVDVGFDAKRLFNLEGGIDAFAKYIDNTIPQYA